MVLACRCWWRRWWSGVRCRGTSTYLTGASSGRTAAAPRCLTVGRCYRTTRWPWTRWPCSRGGAESPDKPKSHDPPHGVDLTLFFVKPCYFQLALFHTKERPLTVSQDSILRFKYICIYKYIYIYIHTFIYIDFYTCTLQYKTICIFHCEVFFFVFLNQFYLFLMCLFAFSCIQGTEKGLCVYIHPSLQSLTLQLQQCLYSWS